MIRNLNPMTFREFGAILPKRIHNLKGGDRKVRTVSCARQDDAAVYRAVSDTWLSVGSGMSVLSVSGDGENFCHFYLDKPVCVNSGILFSLSALIGESAVVISAQTEPETVRDQLDDSYCV